MSDAPRTPPADPRTPVRGSQPNGSTGQAATMALPPVRPYGPYEPAALRPAAPYAPTPVRPPADNAVPVRPAESPYPYAPDARTGTAGPPKPDTRTPRTGAADPYGQSTTDPRTGPDTPDPPVPVRADGIGWVRQTALVVPLILVNAFAVYGQTGWAYDHLVLPGVGRSLILAALFASALESIGIYLSAEAHAAQMAGDASIRLRLGSYGVGALIGTLNFSHFAPGMRPNPLAVTFGALSLVSPVLWAIRSRSLNRDRLRALGQVDRRAVRFSLLRWVLWPGLTWGAFRRAVLVSEVSPHAAMHAELTRTGVDPYAPSTRTARTGTNADASSADPRTGTTDVRPDDSAVPAVPVRADAPDGRTGTGEPAQSTPADPDPRTDRTGTDVPVRADGPAKHDGPVRPSRTRTPQPDPYAPAGPVRADDAPSADPRTPVPPVRPTRTPPARTGTPPLRSAVPPDAAPGIHTVTGQPSREAIANAIILIERFGDSIPNNNRLRDLMFDSRTGKHWSPGRIAKALEVVPHARRMLAEQPQPMKEQAG